MLCTNHWSVVEEGRRQASLQSLGRGDRFLRSRETVLGADEHRRCLGWVAIGMRPVRGATRAWGGSPWARSVGDANAQPFAVVRVEDAPPPQWATLPQICCLRVPSIVCDRITPIWWGGGEALSVRCMLSLLACLAHLVGGARWHAPWAVSSSGRRS